MLLLQPYILDYSQYTGGESDLDGDGMLQRDGNPRKTRVAAASQRLKEDPKQKRLSTVTPRLLVHPH